MKTHHYRRPNGFTLVELLVVIAIIAVLAGAGFAAGNAAISKAKKTTALSTITAIESGINNFYTEYGAMPKDIAADETIDTKSDTTFLKVLLGTETATPILNTRAIKFLSVKEGKTAKQGGLVYLGTGGTTIDGLYDPWGGKFEVILDGNYDESVTPAPVGGGGRRLNGRRSAAWSNGADGVKGGGKGADDVKSWQ